MKLNTYLFYLGQCKQAFTFYQKVLGGEIVMMLSNSDTPAAGEIPADRQGEIMHARLVIGNAVLMGSDAPPDRHSTPQGFFVSMLLDTAEEAERVFAAFADGGRVIMPIEETFWAKRFGMLYDKFGQPWMINCEKAM